MLSLETILKRTPSDRFQKAATTVQIGKFKVGRDKRTKAPTAVAETWSVDKLPNGQTKRSKYVTSISFYGKGKGAKVSCSCYDFMYRFEEVLHSRGSADIIYSNGEPAGPANPSRIPGCCKHIIALQMELVERDLLNSLKEKSL